jgi:SAM-dependent methyltransferase
MSTPSPRDRTDHPDLETGFVSVDDQPDPSFLFRAMDETALWPAVQRLRQFERDRLALQAGDDLLDVGCGVGDASQALAALVEPEGRVVGLDASETMANEAARRADAAGLAARYRTGDAMAIDEPDASFDACRSERMLQWVDDPLVAIGEMIRVLRPGGRLSLIDTDWRTLVCDIPDQEAMEQVLHGLMQQRGPGAAVGSRLLNVCREAGLEDLELEAAAHTWTAWDPDTETAPSGFFPFDSVVPQLADLGFIEAALAEHVVDQIMSGARRGRFFMAVTMFAVAGRIPGQG